jgi:glycosyltransferase involved in cell wall biosynthesis
MPGKEFKMLCLFDYNAATGFATVSHNIIERFRKHFGKRLIMDIVAINYIRNDEQGKAHAGYAYYLDEDKRQAVHPAIAEESNAIDPLGRHEFLRLLREHDYNIIFVIQDPGVMAGKENEEGVNTGNLFAEIAKIKAQKKVDNRKSFKFVWYFPVDGVPLAEWFNYIHTIDLPVAYTEYARGEVYKIRPDMKGKIKVILHGVDTKTFFPISDNDRFFLRGELFGLDAAKKTVIGNVNRNQTRKDIPTTIFAFEEYLRAFNANAFLYLHMAKNDPQGWNLPMLLKQTSLVEGEHYMFQQKESRDITPEHLNKIYNCLDYYVTTTSGEGFGLSILEAMACGIPVIAPYHTSILDISGGVDQRCWCLTGFRKYVTSFDNMIREQMYYEDMAQDMDTIVHSEERTRKICERAQEYATSLDWDIVVNRWIEEFEKLI